ncbi:MAG: hypothetical protein J0H14_15435 [Alphaproteobacteria bacterium]|nr:hypothetical protein [Alphaproteobacteria bacterium]
MTVSADEVRAAQVLTGLAMAIWLMVGLAPGLRRHATTIRVIVLAVYLVGGGAYVVWLALRG